MLDDANCQGVLVGNSSNICCLRTGNQCATNMPAALAALVEGPISGQLSVPAVRAAVLGLPQIVVLRDNSGNVAVDTTAATAGFRRDGTACNTWDAAGNDNCPIRWSTHMAVQCPNGAGPCRNPAVFVYSIPLYSPTPNSQNPIPFNEGKGAIQFARGSGINFTSDRIEVRFMRSGGAPTGTCTANTFVTVPLNNEANVADEVKNAGTGYLLAGNTVTLPSGRYSCGGTVTCFDCTTIEAEIILDGVRQTRSPVTLVPPGTSGQANIAPVPIDVSGATGAMQLRMKCGAPGASGFDFGINFAPYDEPKVLASLACTKLF